MAKRKILAISSGGGHWVQLLRLRPAFAGHQVVYATVSGHYQSDVGDSPFRVVPDATRWNKLSLVRSALGILCLLLKERPDVVVSTGAAPGYFGLRLAKWLGARTVWVDSIANVEELSMSGQKIGAHADLWLTQWPHLAGEAGPDCKGSVL